MTIRLMKIIDYWVGIPLCLLLDLCNRLIRFFPKKEGGTGRKRILFIKLSEMGSIILASPLVKKTNLDYPESEVYFLTFKTNKSLVELLQFTKQERIFTIRDNSFPAFVFDTLKVCFYMRKYKINAVFDLELFSRFTAILAFLSGAEKRIGFYSYCFEGLYRGNLLTHNIQCNSLLHISKSYLSMLETLGSSYKITPELGVTVNVSKSDIPRYIASEENKKQAWRRLRKHGVKEGMKLLLVNSGEGNISLREWPLENFVVLSQMLLKEKSNCLLFLGTQGAAQKASLICRKLGEERCVNLTGETTLPELLDIFNIAEALISNDCGLAHLASLTAIKKFIFFGPESPQIYAPLGDNTHILYSSLPCSPCLSALNHRSTKCQDNLCLKTLSPEKVFNLIQENTK